MTPAEPDWSAYLAQFHAQRSGITEGLLGCATDSRGRTPYSWLAEAVPMRGRVLDLACGSAPMAELLHGAQYVGVDLSRAELHLAAARGLPVAQADAARLPVAAADVDAVVCSMALQLLPLEPALAEVRRVMRPGGRFVATVPVARPMPPRDALRWARLLVALREPRLRYPNDDALARADEVVAAAGLTLVSDDAQGFGVDVVSQAAADQLLDGLYLPGAPGDRLAAARRVVRGWVGRRITLPIRRLVACV
ncbi:MAG: class I SAM-dependent methyltransferase [Mycobacteriales bacterium]